MLCDLQISQVVFIISINLTHNLFFYCQCTLDFYPALKFNGTSSGCNEKTNGRSGFDPAVAVMSAKVN